MGYDTNNPFSLNAAADLHLSQYCGVKVDTNGNAALPSSGGSIIGVLYNKPTALGRSAQIFGPGSGVRKLAYGGSVTAGDVLKVNASGQFVTAAAGDIAAGSGVGIALVTGVSGAIGTGILIPGAGAQVATGGDETVTSGALSAYTDVSYISVTGTQAYTLPNGIFAGQKKKLECSVAATIPLGTVTITTPSGSETAAYIFTVVGQSLEFVWKVAGGSGGWHLVRKVRAGKNTYTMGTNNVAAGDLFAQIDLSVTGTQSSSLANGGAGANTCPGEMIHITCSTAASIPNGTLTGTNIKSTVGVSTATGLTGINATSAQATLWWDGAFWQAIASATLAFT